MDPDEGLMKSHTVRTTDSQWSKLINLGGGKWVRAKIDAAKISIKKRSVK